MRLGEFGENLEGKRLGMDVDGTCLCGWLCPSTSDSNEYSFHEII